MKYPNNDLWSVRQIEYLYDALNGYDNKECDYFTTKEVTTTIEGIATYRYKGVIVFFGQDRTIMLEYGDEYGLDKSTVLKVLAEKNIKCNLR